MDKLYIVIPAYNEESNIRTVVEEWYPVVMKYGTDSRLLLVNDGSKDSTLEIMKELASEKSRIEIIDKPKLIAHTNHVDDVILARFSYLPFHDIYLEPRTSSLIWIEPLNKKGE